MNDPNVHYVKFMRGSVSAWETLKTTPNKISNDTLYFVYENENGTEGKLYLGLKLISGVGGNFSGDINISDIGDIYIDNERLSDKQILVYNDYSEQWENTSLSTIINTAVGVMTGATAAAAGTSGLVPQPQAGDQDKFLKGDGTWTPVNIPTFNPDIFSLDNNLRYTLNGYGLAPVNSVPIKTNNGIEWSDSITGSLDYEVTTLEKIQAQIAGTDPDPINTNTIYLIDNGNDPSSSNKYDEYIVVNNHLEQVGTFGQVNLLEYVKVTTFETAISSLEDVLYDKVNEQTGLTELGLISRVTYLENHFVSAEAIGDLDQLILSDGNLTLVDEVNTINTNVSSLAERLKWQELQENNN